jgi:citrate lyase subunit beta/citryl-CoA lyase
MSVLAGAGGRLVDASQNVPVASLLFVAGSDESALREALAVGAGAVVADLEDLVPPADKAVARDVVAGVFSESGTASLRMVRINGAGPGLRDADLAALRGVPLDAVLVPKADLTALDAAATLGLPLLAVVETAAGVRSAFDLAAHPSVLALSIGIGDLTDDLRLPRPVADDALFYTRSKLIVDSAAARAAAPFDAPSAHVGEALRAEAERARALGFGGKVCRTAEQVQTVNDVFSG